jgi:hypothetical protein
MGISRRPKLCRGPISNAAITGHWCRAGHGGRCTLHEHVSALQCARHPTATLQRIVVKETDGQSCVSSHEAETGVKERARVIAEP